eukprot:g1917.t1
MSDGLGKDAGSAAFYFRKGIFIQDGEERSASQRSIKILPGTLVFITYDSDADTITFGNFSERTSFGVVFESFAGRKDVHFGVNLGDVGDNVCIIDEFPGHVTGSGAKQHWQRLSRFVAIPPKCSPSQLSIDAFYEIFHTSSILIRDEGENFWSGEHILCDALPHATRGQDSHNTRVLKALLFQLHGLFASILISSPINADGPTAFNGGRKEVKHGALVGSILFRNGLAAAQTIVCKSDHLELVVGEDEDGEEYDNEGALFIIDIGNMGTGADASSPDGKKSGAHLPGLSVKANSFYSTAAGRDSASKDSRRKLCSDLDRLQATIRISNIACEATKKSKLTVTDEIALINIPCTGDLLDAVGQFMSFEIDTKALRAVMMQSGRMGCDRILGYSCTLDALRLSENPYHLASFLISVIRSLQTSVCDYDLVSLNLLSRLQLREKFNQVYQVLGDKFRFALSRNDVNLQTLLLGSFAIEFHPEDISLLERISIFELLQEMLKSGRKLSSPRRGRNVRDKDGQEFVQLGSNTMNVMIHGKAIVKTFNHIAGLISSSQSLSELTVVSNMSAKTVFEVLYKELKVVATEVFPKSVQGDSETSSISSTMTMIIANCGSTMDEMLIAEITSFWFKEALRIFSGV